MRSPYRTARRSSVFLGLLGIACGSILWSQNPSSSPPPTRPGAGSPAPAAEANAAGRAVVIERAPVIFRDPARYQVNLHLKPVRRLTLTASVDGIVSSIQTKIGTEIASQAEAVRLDAGEAQLLLQRAQAALKAAKADLEGATNKAAAEARVEVAEADLKIAEYRQSRLIIRSPFKGDVIAIHAVEGEFVRAGQPLVDLIDPTQLSVDIPVDGRKQNTGDMIELKIEDATVTGQLEAVIPLTPEFDPLRELSLSPSTGRVVLENSGKKWRAGQTVYSPMIPRLPVAEVPSGSIQNGEQGTRKVQVIREGFVRDIPVELLGQLGGDHLFVSGRFGVTDELIVKTSETLLDGARVTSRDAKGAGSPANSTKPDQPAPRGSNF